MVNREESRGKVEEIKGERKEEGRKKGGNVCMEKREREERK